MQTVGIVAEFNPFHNGHRRLVEAARARGMTHVTAVMSGNFVQRGEAAFADKFLRAKAAVCAGVDLVLDLPVPWSLGGAATFARGGVSLLAAVGCGALAFGCETEDAGLLSHTADLLQREDIAQRAADLMKQGLTYPSALHRALLQNAEDTAAALLKSPNNVLAVEYIKALRSEGASLSLLPFKRYGAAHDADSGSDWIRSGAALRAMAAFSSAAPYMPPEAYAVFSAETECFLDRGNYETAVLTALRLLPDAAFEQYVDDRSGLKERLRAAVKTADSLEVLLQTAKTKSITLSKVRRETMHLFLQIPPSFGRTTPSFVRVLAANERGLEVLSASASPLPVLTRHAQTQQLSAEGKALYELQCRATDLYGLCTKQKRACCAEQTSSIQIIRSAPQSQRRHLQP